MYRISRYWNRFAYLIMHLGWKMIWDYTEGNKSDLYSDMVLSPTTEDVMCGR